MCGIFGIIDNNSEFNNLKVLMEHSRQRGKDSSGLVCHNENLTKIYRADYDILKLYKKREIKNSINNCKLIAGHSRLITNGLSDNQPVLYNDVIVIHNGIIINHEEVWNKISKPRNLEVDSEIIGALTELFLEKDGVDKIKNLGDFIFQKLVGVISCAIILPKQGKLVLISNNGSLYIRESDDTIEFSSEEYPINDNPVLHGTKTYQLLNKTVKFDINFSKNILQSDYGQRKTNLIGS